MDFPLEIEWCKAIFQGCGEVYLQRASFSTLAGITPGKLMSCIILMLILALYLKSQEK